MKLLVVFSSFCWHLSIALSNAIIEQTDNCLFKSFLCEMTKTGMQILRRETKYFNVELSITGNTHIICNGHQFNINLGHQHVFRASCWYQFCSIHKPLHLYHRKYFKQLWTSQRMEGEKVDCEWVKTHGALPEMLHLWSSDIRGRPDHKNNW